MRFAELNNKRILANPLEKNAICPLCKTNVIAKCGEIKIWHWAHKNNCECDSFGEPETEWHLNWKNCFPKECQEIIIENHRADVKINNIVIEFQNSPISPEKIKEREDFYEKLKWVLNGENFAKNLNLFNHKTYYKFKWKWMPKSWLISWKPIYIDLSFLKLKLKKEIEKYENGKKHYCETIETSYEWEDDYGNIRESDFPIHKKHYFEDTELHLKCLNEKYNDLLSNDLFLIKKLSKSGTGWGRLISKEKFIMECEDGYYRD